MALAELIGKLKTKRQTAHRSVYSQYLAMVKNLASGQEVDSDEVEIVLASANKTEDDLLEHTEKRQEWLQWHSQLMQNKQAVQDRLQAERDLQAAQAALQAAYDKLMPAIELAQFRLNDANHRFMTTTQAESWLAENVLDHELIEREAAVVAKLRKVNQELAPLLADREHKRSSLMNAELCLRQITGRSDDAWPTLGTINSLFWRNKDTIPAQERVADVRSQLSQLEQAIRPRQQEQQRLQAELNSIHQEKLKP
jgi:hypothetical protein